jgi:hypothetical protein
MVFPATIRLQEIRRSGFSFRLNKNWIKCWTPNPNHKIMVPGAYLGSRHRIWPRQTRKGASGPPPLADGWSSQTRLSTPPLGSAISWSACPTTARGHYGPSPTSLVVAREISLGPRHHWICRRARCMWLREEYGWGHYCEMTRRRHTHPRVNVAHRRVDSRAVPPSWAPTGRLCSILSHSLRFGVE